MHRDVGLVHLGSAMHLPEKPPEENSASRQLHPYGRRNPQPMKFGPPGGPSMQSVVHIFASVGSVLFVVHGTENGQFLYLMTTAHNTV
jgi:hypothetical protein